MQEIIKAQGGNSTIDSEDLTEAALRHRYHAPYSGLITDVDDKKVDQIARILGAPHEKLAGIYINKQIGQKVRKGERIFTLYAQNQDRIDIAIEALKNKKIFQIKRTKAGEGIRG